MQHLYFCRSKWCVHMRNDFLYEREKWRGSYQRNRCEDDFMICVRDWRGEIVDDSEL